MAQPYDVCIRGSGIVGRTLALLLARDRLRVALVQSPQPPQGATADVRAYALNAASRQLLESVRCWPEEDTATPVQAMQVKGDQDGAVHFDAPPASALAWIVDVPVLEARLADAVRYQPLVDTVDSPVPAALTVVCEGRASSSRAEFGVEFDSTPYPRRPSLPGWCVKNCTTRPLYSGSAVAISWLFCLWAGRQGTLWRWCGL